MMTLMAGITGLKLTFLDAWTTKPIERAMPAEHNPGLKDVEYACWRSHADAWRMVVQEGWATAMILEDDVDWDGGIHESMALAWEALKNITGDPEAVTSGTSSSATS
jgi:Glycosyltransferase family 25 (LPS biosynthesis protein)